jgi:hypothetical protein
MSIFLTFVLVLAAWSAVSTLVVAARDGYRRAPLRPSAASLPALPPSRPTASAPSENEGLRKR